LELCLFLAGFLDRLAILLGKLDLGLVLTKIADEQVQVAVAVPIDDAILRAYAGPNCFFGSMSARSLGLGDQRCWFGQFRFGRSADILVEQHAAITAADE